MRIVSFGFQTWGRKTLQALIDSEHEVVLAVTFALDESGLLHVSAVAEETNASARAELRLVAIDEVR